MAETKGISQLIERIKNDGILAGDEERERILSEARAQADTIVSEARLQADRILDDSRKQEKARREQVDAALRMAAHDFVSAFKHVLRGRHIRPLIVDHVSALLEDENFLGETIRAIFCQYVVGTSTAAEVVVHPDLKQKLTAWLAHNLEEDLIKNGVVLREDSGLKGFRFKRENEAFYWDFTLQTVADELALLVDPGLRAYLEIQQARVGSEDVN